MRRKKLIYKTSCLLDKVIRCQAEWRMLLEWNGGQKKLAVAHEIKKLTCSENPPQFISLTVNVDRWHCATSKCEACPATCCQESLSAAPGPQSSWNQRCSSSGGSTSVPSGRRTLTATSTATWSSLGPCSRRRMQVGIELVQFRPFLLLRFPAV